MSGKSARDVISLDGKWRYMQDPEEQGEKKRFSDPGISRDGWKEMAIPTNWYFTEVGDYTGVIWFAREFDLPSGFDDRSVVLRFNGVDYIADVWLNGTYLGNHEGFFNPFEFRVGKLLKPKGNSLVVRVDSPRDDTEYVLLNDATNANSPMSNPYKRNWPAELKIVKGTFIDSEHRPGAYTAFGQDGNTGGIWESVELIASGSLTIDFVKTYTKIVEKLFVPDGTALVSVDFEIYNNTADTVKANVAIDMTGKNFKSVEELKKNKIFTLKPGENIVKLVQTVSKPQLWWSWDLGKPNLYQMKVTVADEGKVSDEVDITFGIREMKVKNGHWFLNGKRIFARGMRYLSSNWMSEMDEKRFREDLDQIKDVNINAIRIGSHVEQPIFYDICDEMGLMVWQVFPLHYSYSDSDDLIERAAPMMRDMVRMFINNASVVMYSTFKEPKVYPIAAVNKDRPAPNNYGRLCEILYEAGHTVDPTKWIHLGDYEEGVQNIMPGFCQPGRNDVKNITLKPQIVEFGCGAVPCRETMEQIFKPEDLWPPNWDQWAYHNMRYTMFDWQELEVKDLDQLIEDSQDFAARQIKESAEFFRQRKHNPIGSIFLYFWNDPWPCIGSGLLDYYRRPYKSYHIYGMVYSPVLVSIEWIKDQHHLGFEKIYDPGETFTAKIWVTNDLHQEYPDAQLTWALKDPDGKVVENGTKTILIAPDESHVEGRILWPIPDDAAKGEYRVEASVTDKGGKTLSENYFVLRVK